MSKQPGAMSKQPNASRASHFLKATIVALLVLGIGVLLIAQAGESHILRDLGIALVPVGLVALLYELILRETFVAEMRERLNESLRSHFSAFDRMNLAGVVDAEDSFDTTKVGNFFARAKTVRILQTWIPEAIPTLRQIRECVRNGGQVRILLLNPDSEVARLRSQQLGYLDKNQAAKAVESNLAEIARIVHEISDKTKIQVRLYDILPVVSIYAFDDQAYLGVYWYGLPAISGPQLLVRQNGHFYGDAIDTHFEKVWASAMSINDMLASTNQLASTAAVAVGQAQLQTSPELNAETKEQQ